MCNEWGSELHLLEWVIVGMMLCHWNFWVGGKSCFPKLLIKAPMGRFFFEKFVYRVAYEKIKLKDGKDVEV